jgi:malonate-semialdehyde dehydrogenase (acetylating)/methylmalonate-semialdehyde dehydrogenase
MPFNFPVMITFWFMPYAIATGNTYIVKPSEKVPQTMTRIFELFEELNFPPGVLNMVHGGKPVVDAILQNSHIQAVSFVGSTKVAQYIYTQGTANGKRVQAQGGAKNPVLIMPDADPESTVKILTDSAFGCAGQRCLAASLAIMTRETAKTFLPKLAESAASKVCGYGMKTGTGVGAIITQESKNKILDLIEQGLKEGASLLLDGRNERLPEDGKGNFIAPTILDDIKPNGVIHNTEIFGPVLGILYANDLDHAIELINGAAFGNAASIFTTSGAAARKFRHDVLAGNIGINIGVAAPMAYFPFSGWKKSFYGDLHAQSRHAVEFYTQTKVVVERWNDQWSRKF